MLCCVSIVVLDRTSRLKLVVGGESVECFLGYSQKIYLFMSVSVWFPSVLAGRQYLSVPVRYQAS